MTIRKKNQETWIYELINSVTNINELLNMLGLTTYKQCFDSINAHKIFSLRVSKSFISRMTKNNPLDPLLLQILPHKKELIENDKFIVDPLQEKNNIISSGLIKKYNNRVLLLLKNSCAVHCRYCFRKYFPYSQHSGNKKNWLLALKYIKNKNSLNEVILSGGDPLMAKDHEIEWIIKKLANINHIKKLRIHTRLPVVIPSRITKKLCNILRESRLKILLVTHINHAQEINDELRINIKKLYESQITLLNQSVLLRGINDNEHILSELSNQLFDMNILPYYLHMLDQVKGTTHFYVSEQRASSIVVKLLRMVSGFLVPKLVRENSEQCSKIPVNLNLV